MRKNLKSAANIIIHSEQNNNQEARKAKFSVGNEIRNKICHSFHNLKCCFIAKYVEEFQSATLAAAHDLFKVFHKPIQDNYVTL